MAYPHFFKLLRNAGWVLILLSMFLFLHGCQSYSKPVYSGRIIDLETGDPLPNTIVDIKYWKGSYGLIEQHSKVISWYKIKTDENGYFQAPSISTPISIISWDSGVTFSIYKKGYTELNMFNLGDCLSHGCKEEIYNYSKDKTKKIIISSHKIELSKLDQ